MLALRISTQLGSQRVQDMVDEQVDVQGMTRQHSLQELGCSGTTSFLGYFRSHVHDLPQEGGSQDHKKRKDEYHTTC